MTLKCIDFQGWKVPQGGFCNLLLWHFHWMLYLICFQRKKKVLSLLPQHNICFLILFFPAIILQIMCSNESDQRREKCQWGVAEILCSYQSWSNWMLLWHKMFSSLDPKYKTNSTGYIRVTLEYLQNGRKEKWQCFDFKVFSVWLIDHDASKSS